MLCLHFSTMFKLLNFIFVFKSFSFICSNYSTSFVQIIQIQPTIPHGLLGRINLSKLSSLVNVFCVWSQTSYRGDVTDTGHTNGPTEEYGKMELVICVSQFPWIMIDMNDFGATIKCGQVPTIYAAHCFGVWGVFKVNLGKVFSHSQRCRMHSYTLGLVFQHTWK